MTRLTERDRWLRTVSEKDWQAQVLDILAVHGWDLTYHTHDSRRSAVGFPDVIAVRERDGDILAAELKTETGLVKAEQFRWLKGLERAGVDCYVWRPRDVDAVIARATWPDQLEEE